MKLGIKVGLLFLILIFCFTGKIMAFSVPAYSGFVNDFAKVLNSQTKADLENQLREEAAKENGVEIAVITLSNLDGQPVEDIALQFFDSWKIGKKNSDNGVLLLLAIKEREIRIQTGYGAEVFLPDAVAGDIIRNQIVPYLAKGDYDGAVNAGVEAIILRGQTIDKKEITQNKSLTSGEIFGIAKNSPVILMFLGVLISYLVAFLGRSKAWWPGGVVGAIIGYIFWQMSGAVFVGIIGLFMDFILSRNYKNWQLENKTTTWRNTWGGFHNNNPPFRFGGGRSGGGGASGKW